MDDEFAEQLHNLQDQALLTRKEADFRSYLVKTGVAEDIVKLLVGMEEADGGIPEEEAVNFVREKYGSRDLALEEGKPIDIINEVIDENTGLKARLAELESQFADTLGRINAVETGKRKEALESLIALHPSEPEETEDEEEPPPVSLDLGKMYAALLARFPAEAPPPETVATLEGDELAPPEVVPWSAESAEEPPTGTASLSVIEAWYPTAFAMDAAYNRPHEPALFDELVSAADPTPPAEPAEGEEPPAPMEFAKAVQLHALFWTLATAAAPVASASATPEPTE